MLARGAQNASSPPLSSSLIGAGAGAFFVLFFSGCGVLLLPAAGVFAAGVFAAGVFAAGVFAAGVFAAGVFAAGVFAAGVFAAGVFAAGVFAAGAFATGVFATGVFATGDLAASPVYRHSQNTAKAYQNTYTSQTGCATNKCLSAVLIGMRKIRYISRMISVGLADEETSEQLHDRHAIRKCVRYHTPHYCNWETIRSQRIRFPIFSNPRINLPIRMLARGLAQSSSSPSLSSIMADAFFALFCGVLPAAGVFAAGVFAAGVFAGVFPGDLATPDVGELAVGFAPVLTILASLSPDNKP
jgi:hypothetical protein